MTLTINEAITRFEANAEQNERWASGGLNPEANAEYAAEHRQLAAWLRELQERRETLGVIRCKDCKHLYNKIRGKGVCQTFNGFSSLVNFNDYCSKAERRDDVDD